MASRESLKSAYEAIVELERLGDLRVQRQFEIALATPDGRIVSIVASADSSSSTHRLAHSCFGGAIEAALKQYAERLEAQLKVTDEA